MNEFEFLGKIRKKYQLDKTGDDCAVIPSGGEKDLLMTVDMLVEGVDFRTEWTTPELLGHKALAVSLSDIAAMGGKPKWAMISIAVPSEVWTGDLLDRFYHGWQKLAAEFDVELVGGDISRTPTSIVIDTIVGGEVPKGKALLRSTARPGDAIFVSGNLGGAAGGLRLLENGARSEQETPSNIADLLIKQLKPAPDVVLANTLISLRLLTSAIDISDGLSSDLGHICAASQVGAVVDATKIPIDPLLIHHFSPDECLDMALNGGEDYRLLFTVDPKDAHILKGLEVTRIGEMTHTGGRITLLREGRALELRPHGFRHF